MPSSTVVAADDCDDLRCLMCVDDREIDANMSANRQLLLPMKRQPHHHWLLTMN
jgi:hypothetical protein